MGCFWGAERVFWQAAGRLHDGGRLRRRLHAEPDLRGGLLRRAPATPRSCSSSSTPHEISYEAMLRLFWEGHDPTQGMRQGNDVGTQYRSAIYWTTEAQREAARALARDVPGRADQGRATARSRPRSPRPAPFYYAEDYHQQYLAKNPNGYCGLGGTGVSCPVGARRGAAGSSADRLRGPAHRPGRRPHLARSRVVRPRARSAPHLPPVAHGSLRRSRRRSEPALGGHARGQRAAHRGAPPRPPRASAPPRWPTSSSPSSARCAARR